MFVEQGLDGRRLGQEIVALLGDRGRLQAMAKASSTLAHPEARDILVGECLAMVAAKKANRSASRQEQN
jgi:hypothetical protein